MNTPFIFIPKLFPRLWGGHNLHDILHRQEPDTQELYGESWEICDRAEHSSIVAQGKYKGKTLHELWTTQQESLFGIGYERFPFFPLLCKILDAEDVLSLQVHPPENIAKELNGESKTECWYIYRAHPEACLFAGWNDYYTHADIENALNNKHLDKLLHKLPAYTQQSIHIPSGRVHAIGAGLMIFEIQENSDTTYRLYDWNRVDGSGNPRELHKKEALKSLVLNDICPAMRSHAPGVISQCSEFIIEQRDYTLGESVLPDDQEHFSLLILTKGSVQWGDFIAQEGDFLLAPRQLNTGNSIAHNTSILHVTVPLK